MSEPGLVHLTVTLHEDEEPEWAEWELWRYTDVGSDDEYRKPLAVGTGPSLLAAVDAAANAFIAAEREPERSAFVQELLEDTAPDPRDGPVLTDVKAILREPWAAE